MHSKAGRLHEDGMAQLTLLPALPRAEMSPDWDTDNQAGCTAHGEAATSLGHLPTMLPPVETKMPHTHTVPGLLVSGRCHHHLKQP